jgi:hypothetical protein
LFTRKPVEKRVSFLSHGSSIQFEAPLSQMQKTSHSPTCIPGQ